MIATNYGSLSKFVGYIQMARQMLRSNKIRGIFKYFFFSIILIICFLSGVYSYRDKNIWDKYFLPITELVTKDEKKRADKWDERFQLIKIKSSVDGSNQKSFFFKPDHNEITPLIVSLHTWSGDFSQLDEMAKLVANKNWSYIHPNARGPNWTMEACCNELAIADIDDAIDYAVKNATIDKNKIYVVGESGGAYTALCLFMKSRHYIAFFSVWNPITDLVTWYDENLTRGNNTYASNIMMGTGSILKLNVEEAKKRSPLYMKTPCIKLQSTKLELYAGIDDGHKGPVPITHSLFFYNKIIRDCSTESNRFLISDNDILSLLTNRNLYPRESDGKTIFKKEYGNVKIEIFDGAHDMKPQHIINSFASHAALPFKNIRRPEKGLPDEKH